MEEQKQALGTGDNPQDNIACVPFSVIMKLHPEFKDVIIMAKADSTEDLPVAVDEVRGYLRRMRRLPSDKKDDFEIMTTDTFVQTWKEISNGIFIVMLAVGSVALLVGGIGVMNIMLVSVTERTREIGVRKAIGARQSNILTQFLLNEAVTRSLCLGGTIGWRASWLLHRTCHPPGLLIVSRLGFLRAGRYRRDGCEPDRRVLRRLSGVEGCAVESGRGAQVRVRALQ